MISKIKKKLNKSFEVVEFLYNGKNLRVTPHEVYKHDIKNCVMQADCMLAICDFASLGLGYEIATTIEKRGLPVLAVAHKDSVVSRLIRGIDHKNFQFHYYDSVDDIIEKTMKLLTK